MTLRGAWVITSLIVIMLLAFTSLFQSQSGFPNNLSPDYATAYNAPINSNAYGMGLDLGFDINSNVLCGGSTSMTGGVCTTTAFETAIQKYLLPIGVKYVTLDVGWLTAAQSSILSHTVGGRGIQSWVSDWLQASQAYGIKNIMDTSLYGYGIGTSSSWWSDAITDYPAMLSANSTGQKFTYPADANSRQIVSVASPDIALQYETDLTQLMTWYGSYAGSSWVGMGEGCCNDGTEFWGSGISPESGWDNSTLNSFANSQFFLSLIDTSTGKFNSYASGGCFGTSSITYTMFVAHTFTYNTNQLYNEINTCANQNAASGVYSGGILSFMRYEEALIGWNVTQYVQTNYAKTLLWYTEMPQSIVQLIPGFNPNYFLFSQANFGSCFGVGPNECQGTSPVPGSSNGYWPSNTETMFNSLLSLSNQQINLQTSIGDILDNTGNPSSTDFLGQYLMTYPMVPAAPLSLADATWGINCGRSACPTIDNLQQQQYTRGFGSILNRMENNGLYFGSQDSAAPKVLWITSSDDGLFPEFTTPALNIITYPNNADQNVSLYGSFSQFNVIVGMPESPTANFLSRLQAFVQSGGGYVDTSFGELPNITPCTTSCSASTLTAAILGLSTSGISAPNSVGPETIAVSSPITSSYPSINFGAYWTRYQISTTTSTIYMTDSVGNPVLSVNTYVSGHGVEIEQPYAHLSNVGNGPNFENNGQYGTPRDSWVSLFINAVYAAAGKTSMLPIIWQSSYNSQQNWSPYLQYSIDGTPSEPILLWLSNNDTVSSPFQLDLSATFFGIGTGGWIAMNVATMQVIGSGTGNAIDISTNVPAQSWAPIYIMSYTSSPSSAIPLYTTDSLLSQSTSGGYPVFNVNGFLNSSSWLVMEVPSGTTFNSVISSYTGAMPKYPDLQTLSQSVIGYQCPSLFGSGACSSFVFDNQQGWYYDSTNNLLYIHYEADDPISLTLSPNTGPAYTPPSNSAGSFSPSEVGANVKIFLPHATPNFNLSGNIGNWIIYFTANASISRSSWTDLAVAQEGYLPNGNWGYLGYYEGTVGAVSGCQQGMKITITVSYESSVNSTIAVCPAAGGVLQANLNLTG